MQLNEGLEKLGTKEIVYEEEHEGGVFNGAAIESIRLPSTLKRVEKETFSFCNNLKRVEIPNSVEYVGKECFSYSCVEEVVLPSTLKKIDKDVFE